MNIGTTFFVRGKTMGLNLRAERTTPITNLIQLFKDRSQNVAARLQNEKIITEQNGKLTQQLQALFKPLAAKFQIGFGVCIKDGEVEVSTRVDMPKKNRQGQKCLMYSSIKLCITTIPIHVWMDNPKELETYIVCLEKYLRFITMTTRKERASGKLLFTNPNTVTISIETRNRYF